MTFKRNWEKQDQYFTIEPAQIAAMVALAFPNKTLHSYKIISGGCANLNIQITLTDSMRYILRIYVRDQDAAFREQKIAKLIKHSVPIPEVYFIDQVENLRFAIVEYMEGITLRDVLLDHNPERIDEVMHEVGRMLVTIRSFRFPGCGFFDKELHIAKILSQKEYAEFAKECLLDPTVIAHISSDDRKKIDSLLNRYGFLYPPSSENHLVHADFDPANILVMNKNGKWTISSILDWEFAFSGSSLCDLANMLRYAHEMPPIYEEAFLEGLQQGRLYPPSGLENKCTSFKSAFAPSLSDKMPTRYSSKSV